MNVDDNYNLNEEIQNGHHNQIEDESNLKTIEGSQIEKYETKEANKDGCKGNISV